MIRETNGTPGSPGPPVRKRSTPRGAEVTSDTATRSDSRPGTEPNGSSRTLSDPQLNPAIPGHGRTSRNPARLCAARAVCAVLVGCEDGAPVQPDTNPATTAAATSPRSAALRIPPASAPVITSRSRQRPLPATGGRKEESHAFASEP